MRIYLTLSTLMMSLLFLRCGELPETPLSPEEAEEEEGDGEGDFGTGGEDGGDDGFSTSERHHASLLGQWAGGCRGDDFEKSQDDYYDEHYGPEGE